LDFHLPGIFEGTVFFTTANDSSGHRLRVAEGDTVTAEYEDHTLPEPYTTADELDFRSRNTRCMMPVDDVWAEMFLGTHDPKRIQP
jgi:hypothetical protein